ncbi:universal stress protein [Halalkalicoccus subterraneus]|uniref:universal stress protein n=1 Tax=Halalkalicoccus subterraneus TaxID=2675002 RepID=UPI000EFAEA50|nr:universal stress protein [Halalkalicoccus subterraneus]
MYRVLLAIDDNVDHARTQAETIKQLSAQRVDTEIILLHVFTNNTSGASIGQIKAARTAEDELADIDGRVTMDETSGDPSEMILRYIENNDINLICLGGRKRSPTGKALFGSVTQDVILGTDRPVLVCGGNSDT